jgi:hypothetical protein
MGFLALVELNAFQFPGLPWWVGLYQGGNPNCRKPWRCEDERGYRSVLLYWLACDSLTAT